MNHPWRAALFVLLSSVIGAADTRITGEIVDAATGQPVAARLYVEGADGTFHFAQSADPAGKAVRYDKQNWINARSVERHTTLSAHPFQLDLPPGKYTFTVERGKEYFAGIQTVTVGTDPQRLRFAMRRWINLAERGWYSGETHIHRPLDELPTLVEAEDLNVAFPLSYWVTKAFEPPLQGDKNVAGEIPSELIRVDGTHVIWPRNTEYEIFTVHGKRHTLGALFVLNHKSVLPMGVPPVGPMAVKARAEGALFDLDKHDWPWAMSLISSADVELFELANNHVWRTEFAFKKFNANASAYLFPPGGGDTGDERDWLHFTWNTYYTLLNCGYRLQPTAGTASGVHPVPVGFSRVYVHLPDGFSYEKWLDGLKAGRSFVTTGPMLLATANEKPPGHRFTSAGEGVPVLVAGEVQSEHPLVMAELLVNGEVMRTVFPQNVRTDGGALKTEFRQLVPMKSSGWIAVRAIEELPNGRMRFGHTAPWWIDIAGKPHLPRQEEAGYLVRRMDEELARSRGALPVEAIAEYEQARNRFAALTVQPDDLSQARRPTSDAELRHWLENMAWHHRYTLEEMRSVTGMSLEELRSALQRFDIADDNRPARPADAPLLVLPYPGGRHPRTGFHDGARNPQRDTKISVFSPWKDGGYVVVDVPEAIFSNLGLTYLAHTHVPTIWTKADITLPPVEWLVQDDGRLTSERTLPNQIAFGAVVTPAREHVEMELWLRNGTAEKLTGLRTQVCVMLQGLNGFRAQTGTNKVLRLPYAACRSNDGQRWIITAWTPLNRAWANPPVPCLHSDPQFPDCAPGETVRVRGRLWFAEGVNLDAHLQKINSPE